MLFRSQTDLDHLPRIVPLVYRRRGIETFIALQPDQRATERFCKNFGNFCLANSCFAFEKQRAVHFQRKEDAGRVSRMLPYA